MRGTTLRQSILRILDRLHPKKIIVVSSSPQIRYPDYYGIDMSSMEQFIAFKAALALLKERGMEQVIQQAYEQARQALQADTDELTNPVKAIYAPFSDEEIARKIAQLLTPEGASAPVELIFQSCEGLRKACPQHTGDWYFTGDYPTPGGIRMLNQAFVDYMEKEFK